MQLIFLSACFSTMINSPSNFGQLLLLTLLIVLSIWPNILVSLANLIGFQTISNMVTGVLFVILLFITISLTVIVSGQKKKITLLVQEISILKNRVNDLEEKKGE